MRWCAKYKEIVTSFAKVGWKKRRFMHVTRMFAERRRVNHQINEGNCITIACNERPYVTMYPLPNVSNYSYYLDIYHLLLLGGLSCLLGRERAGLALISFFTNLDRAIFCRNVHKLNPESFVKRALASVLLGDQGTLNKLSSTGSLVFIELLPDDFQILKRHITFSYKFFPSGLTLLLGL